VAYLLSLNFVTRLFNNAVSSLGPRLREHFRNKLIFYGEELLAPTPNSQAGGPPLVGCPRLLIQYIRSFPPSAIRGRAMPW
jgi:hypothetical protein